MKNVMRVFSVVLLIFVGTVFMTGPAGLLFKLTPTKGFIGSQNFWLLVVLIYYIMATMFPVDKIIGKVYPVFGIVLIIMAVGIIGGIFAGIAHGAYHMPEITFTNVHPDHKLIFPFMFITVACGAISGFHSTQSPLMARCFNPEANGRKIFYGAMVCEGVIALVWAAAGCAFYKNPTALQTAYNGPGGAGSVVYEISTGTLGMVGGILAMLGVIACPITSGDTAFRSARLTIADWFNIDQESTMKRLMISVPIFIVGAALSQMNFGVIWRYFSWSNQTLAMIVLWAGSVYLYTYAKSKWGWLMSVIPAVFMTVVTTNYILIAPEGFKLPNSIGFPVGLIFAAVCLIIFLKKVVLDKKVLQLQEMPAMC
jgi:carbon starvation protein CstA